MKPPFANSRTAKTSALVAMVLISAAFGAAKALHSGTLLGLSTVFDFYVLALAWVGVLWSIGVFGPSRPKPSDTTLENADWHIDSVRSSGQSDSRASVPGGLYLSWLIARGHISPSSLIGLEEALSEYEAGNSSITDLFEAFGGKLTISMIRPSLSAFSEEYLHQQSGHYYDDLQEVLGSDLFRLEPNAAHTARIHQIIDSRYQLWAQST